MPLKSGSRLGGYTIVAPLGAGGMGQVWRAKDQRLDREVAIKVLPDAFAQDPERVTRFGREARSLAALNHPHIAQIYGFEEHDGVAYLVLELVEGEDLAHRLSRGPLPPAEACDVARQIAEALEAAHERGIVHRDLKPANVRITPEGRVKVLDFGLAKALDPTDSTSKVDSGSAFFVDLANSAPKTRTTPRATNDDSLGGFRTEGGVVLGTPTYMAPEQACGKPVDKRVDIWAFGCVLYECLTGRRAFAGGSISEVLAAVIEREPDYSKLPASAPTFLRSLLIRCFAKDPRTRLRDVGEARLLLGGTVPTSLPPTEGPLAARGRRGIRAALPWALAAVAAIGCSLTLLMQRDPPSGGVATAAPVVRFTITPPPGHLIPKIVDTGQGIAVSPAGDRIVFVAAAEGKTSLCLRDLGRNDARVLPGTENCRSPFFSPDGKWLGFLSGTRLMKMPAGGGPPLSIADTAHAEFAWITNDVIVYGTGVGGLWRVNADGGQPTRLARAGPDVKTAGGTLTVLGYDKPVAIPGQDYLLCSVWDGDTTESYHLIKVSLSDQSLQLVLRSVTAPGLIAKDRLVFTRGSTVMTVGFDAIRGVTLGDPVVALEEHVRTDAWTDSPMVRASIGGTFAYVPGGRIGSDRRLVLADEAGKLTPLLEGTDHYIDVPAASPDGKHILLATLRSRMEIWGFDLERRSKSLVISEGENYAPVWASEGASIYTFHTPTDGPSSLARVPLGGGAVQFLNGTSGGDGYFPLAALPDGSGLLVRRATIGGVEASDIVLYRFADSMIVPVRNRPASEETCRVAPDGKWIAYESTESGQKEIYVGPFHAPGPNLQVSTNGGASPRISRDGKTVYFVDQQYNLMAVSIEGAAADPRPSAPRKLFDLKAVGVATSSANSYYDVFPNGRFVMIEAAAWERDPPAIHVILNWSHELRTPRSGG